VLIFRSPAATTIEFEFVHQSIRPCGYRSTIWIDSWYAVEFRPSRSGQSSSFHKYNEQHEYHELDVGPGAYTDDSTAANPAASTGPASTAATTADHIANAFSAHFHWSGHQTDGNLWICGRGCILPNQVSCLYFNLLVNHNSYCNQCNSRFNATCG
jgi:hypothetical protein